MINQISQYLKELTKIKENDEIIFNNTLHQINKENFKKITEKKHEITFIDGGQAEIIKAANFNLSFIRIAAITFPQKKQVIKEFYLLTKAVYQDNEIYYKSKIFGDKLIDEEDLTISSNNQTIKSGLQRAEISKVANIARRFSELALANTSNNPILDGTLDITYPYEEKYTKNNFSALAKSSSLFTTSGNSPNIILNKIGPPHTWFYQLNEKTSFVKLNKNSKHILRFEGNKEFLSSLITNSNDALFLGYPYGLILVDKLARISNQEKNSLKIKFLLKNQEINDFLTTSNAHDILDNLG